MEYRIKKDSKFSLGELATGYITWISIGLLSERFYMMFSMMIYLWLQTVYDKWKSQ